MAKTLVVYQATNGSVYCLRIRATVITGSSVACSLARAVVAERPKSVVRSRNRETLVRKRLDWIGSTKIHWLWSSKAGNRVSARGRDPQAICQNAWQIDRHDRYTSQWSVRRSCERAYRQPSAPWLEFYVCDTESCWWSSCEKSCKTEGEQVKQFAE